MERDAVGRRTGDQVIHQPVAIEVLASAIRHAVSISIDSVKLLTRRISCHERVAW